MSLSTIEESFASALGDSTLFLTHFQFLNGQLRLRVSSPSKDHHMVVQATFDNATLESVEEDENERDSWPLDVIGFDCSQAQKQWRFTLNCGNVEWSWVSDWPSISV